MTTGDDMVEWLLSESEFSGLDGESYIWVDLDRVNGLIELIGRYESALEHVRAMQTRGFVTLGEKANELISLARGDV